MNVEPLVDKRIFVNLQEVFEEARAVGDRKTMDSVLFELRNSGYGMEAEYLESLIPDPDDHHNDDYQVVK